MYASKIILCYSYTPYISVGSFEGVYISGPEKWEVARNMKNEKYSFDELENMFMKVAFFFFFDWIKRRSTNLLSPSGEDAPLKGDSMGRGFG